MAWARGPNWRVAPGETLDVYPFFFTANGTVETFTMTGSSLGDRRVWVYLPPSYTEPGAAGRSYPILVMEDGQNLFDPAASGFGTAWEIDQAMDKLVNGDIASAGGVRDVIVVAADHGGTARIYEYTPTEDSGYCSTSVSNDCGGADVYLDFVEDELLPAARGRYRTEAGRVGIAGSSLGGLVSMYACWTRPTAFDRCGVVSPSLWWDGDWIMGQVAGDPGPKRDLMIYVDAGTSGDGLSDVITFARDLSTKTGGLAYTVGDDLLCLVGQDMAHNEGAWQLRAPWMLEWLYPDDTRVQPTPDRGADIYPCAL
jgi:predicted alpha/beta superfamily hydrolase